MVPWGDKIVQKDHPIPVKKLSIYQKVLISYCQDVIFQPISKGANFQYIMFKLISKFGAHFHEIIFKPFSNFGAHFQEIIFEPILKFNAHFHDIYATVQPPKFSEITKVATTNLWPYFWPIQNFEFISEISTLVISILIEDAIYVHFRE